MQAKRGLKLSLPISEMKAEAREQGGSEFALQMNMGYPVDSLGDGEDVSPSRGGRAGSPGSDETLNVDEMTTALIRQHLGHVLGKGHPLVDQFEAAFPRTENSIKKKSVMIKALGIHSNNDKDHSVLYSLIQQCMGPTLGDLTQPATFGAADDGSSLKATSSMTFQFAEDGTSLNVNGLRISEVSSIPFSVVGRLDDLDLDNGVELGKGAGGRVLKARHKVNGTFHAVKEIMIGSDEVMAQVKAEISVLWGSSKNNITVGLSPFVIQCHGVFFSQGKLYIAMECMEGSLKDALDVVTFYPEPLLKAVVFQSLKGLRYLHCEKRQIHRDIKPHNILFNGEGVVKLSDFGIASEKAETVALFQKGTFCGTMVYMSPARAGGASYSFEADIWSLGISILHMALGKLNIATSIFGIAALAKKPPRLPATAPNGQPFSAEIQDFVAQTLCTNPADTPSVDALLNHPWFNQVTIDWSKQQIIQGLVNPYQASSGHAGSPVKTSALDLAMKK